MRTAGYFAFMAHDGKVKVALEPRTDSADRDRAEDDSGADCYGGLVTSMARVHEQYEDLCPNGPASVDISRLSLWLEGLGKEGDAGGVCEDALQSRGPLRDFDSFYDWCVYSERKTDTNEFLVS